MRQSLSVLGRLLRNPLISSLVNVVAAAGESLVVGGFFVKAQGDDDQSGLSAFNMQVTGSALLICAKVAGLIEKYSKLTDSKILGADYTAINAPEESGLSLQKYGGPLLVIQFVLLISETALVGGPRSDDQLVPELAIFAVIFFSKVPSTWIQMEDFFERSFSYRQGGEDMYPCWKNSVQYSKVAQTIGSLIACGSLCAAAAENAKNGNSTAYQHRIGVAFYGTLFAGSGSTAELLAETCCVPRLL